jgi:hypothetical protein|tara:strand:+ start:1687 stop:1911 length:225 start_codon:yes stop_codon:yes gene_type:complete
MNNLADKSEFSEILVKYEKHLRSMLDPEAVNAEALADQAALIEQNGGLDKVLDRGGLAGTPAPGGPSTLVQVNK